MKKEDIKKSSFPCQKITPGRYKYRGWIIQCVGYYEAEHCVCWEAYDPETGCADYRGFFKERNKATN